MTPDHHSARPTTVPKVALVAEDEPLICSMLQEALTDAGLTVFEAENGHEALRVLRGGIKVDLLVTDLEMPGMGGLELIRYVRHESAHTKVIVAASNAHMLDPEDPADVALTKPYSLRLLIGHALSLLEGHPQPA